MRGKVAVVAFVMLAACAQRSAAEVISSAPGAVQTAKTASISLVNTVNVTVGGRAISTKATGVGLADFAHKASNLHLSVSGSSIALQPCEVLARGDVAYTTISPKVQTADGKRWTKIDVGKVTGIDVNSLSSDPTSGVEYLKSVSGDVTTVGTETIRDAKTTHYRFTVTPDQLLGKLTGAARQRVQAQLSQIGIKSVPINAWIDDKNLPRKVSIDMKGAVNGAALDALTVVEMYDYGRAVNLTTPPQSSVRDDVPPAKAFTDCFGVAFPG